MELARIAGRVAAFDAAVREAAGILAQARRPLIAGLATDVAGVTAAIDLARRTDGVADHAGSVALLRDLDVMRRSGWIITTPLEARMRADVVVLAGPGVQDAAGRLGIADDLAGQGKTVCRLCPDGDAQALIARIAQLRMTLSGRLAVGLADVAACAAALRGASYAVIAWSAAQLSSPAVEALCGVVEALNAKSRAAGLPLPPSAEAVGASQVSAWLTGYPLPVGFIRGVPEHDPWRFAATRLIESGEADAAVWVSALGPGIPGWGRRVPIIALVPPGMAGTDVAVEIAIGRMGVDHGGVVYQPRLAALASVSAPGTSSLPPAGAVLRAIALALPPC